MVDFSKIKIRCSALPILMTNGRSKSDPLSETAKTYLRDRWIQEVFGRERFDTSNKYTDKGILCESDSLSLVQEVRKETYFKNKTLFENDFIKGTPDLVICDDDKVCAIKDIKNSWSIWTFANVDEDYAIKTYGAQMQGYMWLTGAIEAELIFTLVNTPEEIMNDELYRLSFKHPEINESDEKAAPFKKNYIFDDIPKELRIKSYKIAFDPNFPNDVANKIESARIYLKSLSL